MQIEVSAEERDLIRKAVDSYLSELRVAIVETKHDKAGLHKEEELLKGLLKKLS
ncbi:MAG TPA: hypothetical protein VK445_09180 [Dissulfurispiraceae bacterium]|nr:hypothetical protein [Dissulfurispiraceae bacterium]